MDWGRFKAEPTKIVLYSYWRSSASWRVRWALNLKSVAYELKCINLLKDENKKPEHLARNPAGALPVLELWGNPKDPPFCLSQSSAMIEWIEEVYSLKNPSLFPGLPLERAFIRSLCQVINADTTPLQTPRVQKRHSSVDEERVRWARDFISEGLRVFDEMSKLTRQNFCFQNQISAADLFLIPQIYNALRYHIDVKAQFPQLFGIYERCLNTDACLNASPEKQIDAPR